MSVHWVQCPLHPEPDAQAEDIVTGSLPMYDPHELLRYMWDTGRLQVPRAMIEPLAEHLSQYVANDVLRLYWKHWCAVSDWANAHPGKGCAMPIFLYGDEARYSKTHQDKFIALCIGSPLVFKQGSSSVWWVGLQCQALAQRTSFNSS